MSNTLKEHREARGLTQRDLAERVGVTVQAISNMEARGAQPRAGVRAKLARVLRVSQRVLFPAPEPVE